MHNWSDWILRVFYFYFIQYFGLLTDNGSDHRRRRLPYRCHQAHGPQVYFAMGECLLPSYFLSYLWETTAQIEQVRMRDGRSRTFMVAEYWTPMLVCFCLCHWKTLIRVCVVFHGFSHGSKRFKARYMFCTLLPCLAFIVPRQRFSMFLYTTTFTMPVEGGSICDVSWTIHC